MSGDELSEFVNRCSADLLIKQQRLVNEYGIGSFDSWNYDQTTKKLYFINKGRRTLQCDVIVVGSWVEEKSDWLWGWANTSLDQEIRVRAEKIKTLVVATGEDAFGEGHLEADRAVAEELAAMSVHILDAMGLYVGPAGKSQIFFAIVSIAKL